MLKRVYSISVQEYVSVEALNVYVRRMYQGHCGDWCYLICCNVKYNL